MANVPNKRMNSASSSRLFAKIPFANRVLSFPFDPCSLRSLLFPNRPESALPALLLGHGARSTPSSRLGIAESDAAALRTEFWQTVYADKDSAYAALACELRLRLEHYEAGKWHGAGLETGWYPMEVTLFDDGHLWDGANSEQWPSGSFGEVES